MQLPENCTDKLYKIRPIVNMLKESFISLKHEEIMCIDEQVVPFKGRSLLKQYNPQKPKKWGYKCYILASIDGELKKEGRGSTDIRVTSVNNVELRAVKWFDNRGVALLICYEAVNPIIIVNRWGRKYKRFVQVKRPSVVTAYNKYMGGVDLFDCMLSLYRIHIQSKKWYHILIWHFFDLIVVQAWILYCRDMKRHKP